MSDSANVMKGVWSAGVQKLIKNEHPNLHDVGCIGHLADVTIKAGMKTLPLDIDQLFRVKHSNKDDTRLLVLSLDSSIIIEKGLDLLSVVFFRK